MREIKYRAYIKSLGWVVLVERINFDAQTIEVDLTDGNGDYYEYDFSEIELMQYTGLKDKNGTEIYEGDILQSQIGEKHIWQVIFDDGCFEIDREATKRRKRVHEKELCCGENIEWYELVKIGNIYENPELLGK